MLQENQNLKNIIKLNNIIPGESVRIQLNNNNLYGSIDSVFLKDMNETNDDYIVITLLVKLPGGIEKYKKFIGLGDRYGFIGGNNG